MKRALALGVVLTLALGMLAALPATAAHTVSIGFPGARSEFYSPFGGPATVTFTFVPGEADASYGLRLRSGGTLIHTDRVFVDGDDPSGSKVARFGWPPLDVANPKTYEVAVYRDGSLVTSESFLLRPRLVKVTGATPNPFFPWIDDGHKDTTDVGFTLAAGADAEARVFRATNAGACCGNLVRSDTTGLTGLSAGPHSWTWDGRSDGGDNLAKGDYFVKIRADDGVLAPVVSKPLRIAIARTYRAKATRSKPARSYHHVGRETPLVLGGDCIVGVSGGLLQILCQGAKVSVYWRWGLASNERIVSASFVFGDQMEDCPRRIRSRHHTRHESSFTMTEDVPNASGHCWLATAKITYSYPEPS